MEDRKLEISDDLLLVRPMDTALVVGAPCAHGDQPHLLALHACTPSQTEERPVDTLWPRCALADVVGAVLADIRLTEGQEAAQRFRDNIDAAAAKYYEADAHTADDACCEASRRTRGREHTCGQNEEAP